jgi:hypothetical protein
MYIGRVYEKILDNDNVYRSAGVEIPRPEFIVLYNGVDPYPDEATLYLSSAFADKVAAPALELAVKVYNINNGRNQAMLSKCKNLGGYAALIDKAREFEARETAAFERETGRTLASLSKEERTQTRKTILDKAMKQALNWCIGNGILQDFLKTHGSEVVNMLFVEFNMDDFGRVREQEGIQKGITKGEKKKTEEDIKNLSEYGMTPEQITQALKLPIETVRQFLGQRLSGHR